jgi:SAM-dependent methyltransferase
VTDQLATTGWPFWTPTASRSVSRALRMAQLEPGERFLDIGCGDGRILAAAAGAGARAIGVETNGELVDEARRHLHDQGIDATVIHGDAMQLELDADVMFAYLSPASLQRLRPMFQAAASGTRLVTIDFGVLGLVPTRVVRGVHLYGLPAPVTAPEGRPGWTTPGTLVAALPDNESLTSVELIHAGGPLTLRASRDLDAAASFYAGTDHAGRGERVAVDLRWHEIEAGTLVVGAVEVAGLGAHYVVVLFTGDDNGLWELSDEGVHNLTARLTRDPSPATWAELLAAAESPPPPPNLRQ